MNIPDNSIKNALKNVYFIWGRGKTTVANELKKKHDFYVYSTDESRDRQIELANPTDQPYMCRDFEKEYGVRDFWELPKEVIADRETHFLNEMTPMMIAELMGLAPLHSVIICEGDIDYRAVSAVATHTVHLCNRGKSFDWFARPDHVDIRNIIGQRTDLSESEKQQIIDNAYNIVSNDEGVIPNWVTELNVKSIIWDDTTSIEQTVLEVEKYFGFIS